MPVVTDPGNGASKNKTDTTFVWNMQGIYYTRSKVIVGYSPGTDGIYAGGDGFPAGTVKDPAVNHPGGNTLCYTRPKYKKGGTAWYTTNSTITSFTSTG